MLRRTLGFVALVQSLSSVACAPASVRPAPIAPPPAPTEPRLDFEELLTIYAQTCSGPEGVHDCAPAEFESTFREELPSFLAHRERLVEGWLAGLEQGAHSPAYGLAWAQEKRAIAPLRRGLLQEQYFYGWESSDASSHAARMRDDQYPRHQARILALTHLTGESIDRAVALEDHERSTLWRQAFAVGEPGGPPDVARWLLLKLTREAAPATKDATTAATEPRGIPTSWTEEGFIVAGHGTTHHDVAIMASVSNGRIESAPRRASCTELPGSRMFPTTSDRSALRLPKRLFSNEANTCLAELEGQRPGDFAGTIGFTSVSPVAVLDDHTQATVTGLALEQLFGLGADSADFHATTRVTATRTSLGTTWIAVEALALARSRPQDSETATPAQEGAPSVSSCVSRLCETKRFGWREASASVVAIYELPPGDPPIERLIVNSAPGGCSETEHDAVGFAGFILLDLPLILVSRSTCDAWEFELHAIAADGPRFIGRGAAGSPV